ncbi:MAG: PAS domain S-box protein [Planctomycetia bacterium]|nr:PAS domain S-box protein [Planctomycetia bacterium]
MPSQRASDSAPHEKELRQLFQQQELVAELGDASLATDDLGRLFAHAAEGVSRVLDTPITRVAEYHPAHGRWQVHAGVGWAEAEHVAIPDGHSERALGGTEAVAVADLRQASDDSLRRGGAVCGLIAPIRHPGHAFGVLETYARVERDFGTGERQFLRSVGCILSGSVRRQRAEAFLRRRENELMRIVDADIIGVFHWDTDGRISNANRYFLRLTGYDELELGAGRLRWAELTPPEYQPHDERALAELTAHGRCTPYEKEYVRRDGRRIPVLVAGVLLHGSTHEGMAFALDLTEVKHAESAVSQLAAIIEGSDDAIISKALDGRILSWNPGAARLYGYEASEIVGSPVTDLVPAAERETHAALMERVRQGERISSLPVRRRRKSGEMRDVALSLSPVRSKEAQVVAIAEIAHDITGQKLLEEQFRQAQKMEAVGRLAGGVAHDFNNLLTIISGYSELLLSNSAVAGKVRTLVAEIKGAGDRAANLTRQLLAFSRKSVLESRVLDPNAVVRDSERLLQRLVGEDIVFQTVLGPNVGHVSADSSQFEQALMNLAVNARDAMPRGGKLTIETSCARLEPEYCGLHVDVQPGNYVLLSVADTGVGMDDVTKARLFEPFFTTKEPGKGTGLGLAMVHGFVKQSGGHLAVYSEPNLGTTFKLYLPRVDAPTSARPAETAQPALLTGRETVLLVEDEEAVRAFGKQILTNCGYTVLEAANGVAAWALLEQQPSPPALIVTDVVMPYLSGRELANRAVGRWPAVKVLFMSGYTDDAIVRHGIIEAQWPFLQKPYGPTVLARKVREVLDAPSRPPQAEPSGSRPSKVLVIDDDEACQRFLQTVLEREGYRVRQAREGAAGMRLCGEEPCDLVICDLFMDGQDGLTTIRQLRQRFPALPVMAVSGGSPRVPGDYLAFAKTFGASAALTKPLNRDAVLQAMAGLLSPRQATA